MKNAMLAALLAALSLAPNSAVPAEPAAVSATLTIPQARYLSTQNVLATLTIDNPTGRSVFWNPLWIEFAIRDTGGNIESRPLVTEIYNISSPAPIPAHSSKAIPISMPACTVESDPCERHVSIKLSVREDLRGRPALQLQTQERTYAFDPDRTATFALDGLSGNRPTIFLSGTSSGSVPQRWLDVAFSIPSESADADRNAVSTAIRAAFEAHGIHVAGTGFAANATAFRIVERLLSLDVPPSLDDTIADVRAEIPAIVAVDRSFKPVDADVAEIIGRDVDDARSRAASLIGLLGIDRVERGKSFANQLVEMRLETQTGDGPYRTIANYPFDVPDWIASDRARVLDVRSSNAYAFAGNAPAYVVSAASQGLIAESYLERATALSPLPARLTVAADRPEIVAFGAVRESVADRYGMQTGSAAALVALQRARDFARQLDAASGDEALVSLVARLPDRPLTGDDAVETSAVALATGDGLDARWRTLDVPGTRTNGAPAAPDASGDPVPIAVPDDARQIEAYADADVRVRVSKGSVSIDCERQIANARARSLDAALREAVDRARGQGKRLRHLVIAAAELPSVSPADDCAPGPLARSTATVEIHAPVDLRFRTF